MDLINKALALCAEIESKQSELRKLIEIIASEQSVASSAGDQSVGENDIGTEDMPEDVTDATRSMNAVDSGDQVETGQVSAEVPQSGLRRDIRRAFTINDRFRFRRELFAGDDSAFSAVLDKLSSFDTLAEADAYLASMPWEHDSDVIGEFMTIVANHFNGFK